jgi:hypothetical protein
MGTGAGNGCMGEGRKRVGACVQPLEVCHQSDLLLRPSVRLGPTSMASGTGSPGKGNTTKLPSKG